MSSNRDAEFSTHANNIMPKSFMQTNQVFETLETIFCFEFFNKYLHLHSESSLYLNTILYLNRSLCKQQYLDGVTFVTVELHFLYFPYLSNSYL